LERNEKYWQGTPKLNRVIFKVIPDAQTRLLSLEAGEIDLISCYGASNTSKTELTRLEKNPDIVVDTARNWKVGHHLVFNTKTGPCKNIKVRKAICHAINAKEIKENVVGEYGIAGKAHLSPASPYADPRLEGYDYNLEKAKQYLKDAGWKDNDGDGVLDKDGTSFNIKLLLTKGDKTAIAEMVQNQLQNIGIQVEIQFLECGAQSKAIKEGKFDLVLFTGKYCSGADPHLHFRQIYHSGIDERYNYIFKNDKLDKLIDRLYTTIERDKRLKVYQEIQKILLENAAAVYIYYEDQVAFYNKRVKNFDPFSGQLNTLWKTCLRER